MHKENMAPMYKGILLSWKKNEIQPFVALFCSNMNKPKGLDEISEVQKEKCSMFWLLGWSQKLMA